MACSLASFGMFLADLPWNLPGGILLVHGVKLAARDHGQMQPAEAKRLRAQAAMQSKRTAERKMVSLATYYKNTGCYYTD